MQMPPLPTGWEPTRLTLQRYGQAITAITRAGADAHPRWSHVSLHPETTSEGVVFASEATPLDDGASLVSVLDVQNHAVAVTAGSDTLSFDLLDGPSPKQIGDSILDLAKSHGFEAEVDTSRYDDDASQTYEQWHAKAWYENSVWIAETFAVLNTGIEGEITGPHLWPHGFDIATEWFSPRVVESEGGANAQIAVGFYPAGDAYFYANPWPYDSAWEGAALPDGVHWHLDGWQGAVLPVSELGTEDHRERVLEFGRFVHSLTRSALS